MSESPLAYDDRSRVDLAAKATKGGAIVVLGNALAVCVTGLGFVVLARQLSPHDFGVVAMVAAIVSVVSIFRDLGLSSATVQRDELSAEQVSSLYWVNVALSGVLCLVIIMVAPMLASAYREPDVEQVAIAIAASLPIGGMASQHLAMLQRSYRFKALTAIKLLGATTGVAIAILLAVEGWGYWALVVRLLVMEGVIWIGVVSLSRWRPGRPSWNSTTQDLIKFGANVSIFQLFSKVVLHLDNILIGLVWGSSALAQYSKAFQVMGAPNNQLQGPLSRVFVTSLARIQNQAERFREFYLGSLLTVILVIVPASGFVLVFAKPLILVVLGDQWVEAAWLFQLLGGTMLLRPVINSFGWIYIAQGRGRELRAWGAAVAIVMSLSYVAGLSFGVSGVAVAHSIAAALLLFPGMKRVYCETSVRIDHVLRKVMPVYGATAISMVIVHQLFGAQIEVGSEVGVLFSGAGAYVAVIIPLLAISRQHRALAREGLNALLKRPSTTC